MMLGFNRYLATDNLYESALYKGIVFGLTMLCVFIIFSVV